MQSPAPRQLPQTQEELHLEIATLIAEGFLSFHPTSPIFFSIENAISQWYQQPETKLVDQIMVNCKEQIKKIALDVV